MALGHWLKDYLKDYIGPHDDNGGGGGGSSDFSTAQVTVVNNTSETIDAEIAVAQDADPPFIPIPRTAGSKLSVGGGEEITVKAVLYKGACLCVLSNGVASGSGDVVVNLTNATITGDCTITIS